MASWGRKGGNLPPSIVAPDHFTVLAARPKMLQ